MFHDATTENGKDDGLDAHTLSTYVHAIMACRQISILRARATAIGKALSVEDVNTLVRQSLRCHPERARSQNGA